MNKLREFRKYPMREVRETARMLFAARTDAERNALLHDKSKLPWHSLARQAHDFLDKLNDACSEIRRQRSTTDAAYRRAEKRSADAANWPDVLSFDKAIVRIMRETHRTRALPKFEKLVLNNPRYFGVFGNPPTKRQLGALIVSWREHGMPRDRVIELQILSDNAREKREAERQAKREREQARKRRLRLNVKDKPVIREVERDKRERGINVSDEQAKRLFRPKH